MLYTGETLQEVFSKALGKPIGSHGKQDSENPNATQEAIARGRAMCAEEVYDYMVRERVYGNGFEFGCYCVYNIYTGLTRFVPRWQAGRAMNGHFRFNFQKHQGEVWGANGHAHTRYSYGDLGIGRNSSHERNEENTIHEDENLNHDDTQLLRAGVVVIKNPPGRGLNRIPLPGVIWGNWSGRQYFNRPTE